MRTSEFTVGLKTLAIFASSKPTMPKRSMKQDDLLEDFTGRDITPGDPIRIFRKPDAPNYS